MIYLASPYSHPDAAVREARFRDVCRAAARLMRAGRPVFSPIAHSHPIAQHGLPVDWHFWEPFDRAHLEQCDELVVLTLDGWRESVGVQAEIRIGSDEGHAVDMLESIKTELDGNELLLADFPEVVYPIECLDGIANRCSGQLYQGRRTHIGWTAKEIVLPTIPGSAASGAIIKVAGITGRIRGMKYKRADGRTSRPSLVVLDDPQTDESARSLSQCATRESILVGAVLGLAGPGKKISGIMPYCVCCGGEGSQDNP